MTALSVDPSTAPAGRRRKITAAVLAFSIVGSIVHQLGPTFKWKGWSIADVSLRLWEWYIEDAAISFSFARNWANGDGLVAFPGGERIEGYSNPTWVALLALFERLGVDGFMSSKIMAIVFGSLTVLVAWRIAEEVVDDRDSYAPLIAPVFLAALPTFAFWNASGLENPIFSFFLAGGLWRTVVEGKRGGFPWASLWFLGLATTRPEAIMYAAWGGFVAMVWSLVAGRGLKPSLQWLVAFFVPFLAYHAVRYQYFAWLFPNTYYAKLGEKNPNVLGFAGNRGWQQLRDWAYQTGLGWFFPVFLSGLIGLRGARRWIVPVGVLVVGFAFLYPKPAMAETWAWWPDDLPTPEDWNELRVWLLLATALILPLFALGTSRAGGRVLCWGMALITLFFSVKAGGDWMKGFRWMSFLSVPAAVLFTSGVEEIASLFQRILGRARRPGWSIPGWTVAVVLVVATLPAFYLHSEWFFGKRETGPFAVKKRVEYTEWLMDRLWVQDERILNLDVDMGAHMWWSKHLMVDMAGLIDVPVAHHGIAEKAFTGEYVFEELKPEIAHVHGGWASQSKLLTYPDWKRDYVEVPGFPASAKTTHTGNHVRRDLFMSSTWTGTPGRQVAFGEGVVLSGWEVPAPVVSVGKSFFVEVGVQYKRVDGKENFRVLGFLSDAAGHVSSFDLPVGYDWLPPTEWRIGEVFRGKFAPLVSEELPPGTYDLGFVVLAADGHVVEPAREEGGDAFLPVPEGVVIGGFGDVPARFAKGEVRFPGVVTLGEAGAGEKAAKAAAAEAHALAEGGDCAGAAAAWRRARLTLPRAEKWAEDNLVKFGPVEARCFVGVADRAADPYDAARALEEARVWGYRVPELQPVAERVGQALFDAGEKAKAEKSWAEAYTAFDAAVRANPSLSWARRYAEEARDHRLGIDDETRAAQKEARQAAEEARKAARAEEAPEAGGGEAGGEAQAPRGGE